MGEQAGSYGCFERDFTIGDVRLGGRCGEIPTVLIGSIFYMKHKIVKDAQTGSFDEEKARELVEGCNELSARLGVRFMLDVIGNTSEALLNYITFLKGVTDAPILLNATLPEVRIEALRELHKRGMLENIVYNSINGFSTPEELEALAELPICASVVQAYNPGSKKPDGPYRTLLGKNGKEGFLEKAKRAGMTKLLIDIPTLDLSNIGTIPYAAAVIQEELGLPVGTAPSNATYASGWLRDREHISREQFRAVDASVNSYLAANGCNFLFIGPLDGCRWVMPAVAAVNAFHVYGKRSAGIRPLTEDHPMYKVL